ncbi:TerD family protein [Streptomyces sp. ACA25]|uniref:protein kinase domain-containing protein n=1 Tax=Streptomyces sp. ACA25 TaxID=3022596 RepID=UPI002306E077|nr:TerD family protein [Streptomyces sp. ACA25]MDB1086606.1 TerD family protein [Streptomyces sp. ACA25]
MRQGAVMDGLMLDGRYRMGQQLGEGGMGTVWEAVDLRLERQVAVKVMSGAAVRHDPRAKQRFDREAKLLAGLSSPFIVTVHDAGEAEVEGRDVLYLVMERLHGRSMDEVLAHDLPPLAEVGRWGEQICRALAVAHDGGVVHRDLKPANVMVCADGLVRVLDFGIAAVLADSGDHARLTSTGLVVGTPAYMAPEQIETGRVEARSDLYALGCMLYALATGRPPFQAEALYALMRQQMLDTPAPPSALRAGLPEEWDDLILALLAKLPEERPGSAAELAERIGQLPRPELATQVPPPVPVAAYPVAAGGAPYPPTRIDPRVAPVATAPPEGERALRVVSGQRAWLADVLPELGRLTVTFGWDVAPGAEVRPEVDVSALVVDAAGQVLSDRHFVFYNNIGPGDRSIWLDTDDRPEEGRLEISFPQMQDGADRVVLALSIHEGEDRGHDFALLRDLTLRFLEPGSGEELLSYRLPEGPPQAVGVSLGELFRGDSGWGFHAVTRGYPGGLAQIAVAHGVNV